MWVAFLLVAVLALASGGHLPPPPAPGEWPPLPCRLPPPGRAAR